MGSLQINITESPRLLFCILQAVWLFRDGDGYLQEALSFNIITLMTIFCYHWAVLLLLESKPNKIVLH